MSRMIRAAIRWCLAGLLLAAYVPFPGTSEPMGGAGLPRAACCAPKACCTVEHACAGGGACASKELATAGSHGRPGASTSVLRAGLCHPEAARVGSHPTLDPIVFASLAGHPGEALFSRSGADQPLEPRSRFSTPQVPPPRA